jgi:ribosome-binding protein aMBF1 (putative translation factor)
MKVFKCDRCLAYYDKETDGVQINLKFSGAMIDLCPECAEKFYGWLGEPQATAKAMFAGKERAE